MVVNIFAKLNIRRIVAHIRRHGPQTRATLTKKLSVTPATITRLTNELLEHGVVEEIPDPSKKGQKGFPSKLLKLKSESLLTTGVYFDPDTLFTCVADLEGNILSQEQMPIEDRGFHTILTKASESIHQQLSKSGRDVSRVVGCGVSYPGQHTDTPGRTLKTQQFSEWPSIDFRNELAKYFEFPVYHINDAKAACLAELYYGACKSYQHYCYIWLSYGIGGAAVINQSLYLGHSQVAAEFSGLFPKSKPRPSGQNLLDTLVREGYDLDRLDQLTEEHLETPCVKQWVVRSVEQITWLCLVIARTFAPDAIVIGGTLHSSLINQIQKAVSNEKELGEDFSIKPPKILRATTDEQPQLGAAVLPIDELINPARYQGRIHKTDR
ncbi:ROK family transcriptional regulator [Vibrio sp. S9_S30]|uniref:ROK family transcriptional regulator n=1 Tax=Vibrio sp. S9_S30 TaxID=2720226 RepID=UPI0016814E14|nr:ROK family transcriptional regulator [Vibrio sp. S9_S30]MBD1556308.1 ROK family transcriptional regulator [Vibrio sp. S9_S30]